MKHELRARAEVMSRVGPISKVEPGRKAAFVYHRRSKHELTLGPKVGLVIENPVIGNPVIGNPVIGNPVIAGVLDAPTHDVMCRRRPTRV
jgi:hypothetical protein